MIARFAAAYIQDNTYKASHLQIDAQDTCGLRVVHSGAR
jgi:hypothetical protein